MSRMDPALLQAYAAIGGVLVAVAGLIFVILQLRSLERSVRTGAHSAMYAQGADFRAHLVAHPHLRKYFFGGAPLERSAEDYERAMTIAELYLNYLEHIAVLFDSFGSGNRAALDGFIKGALEKSPILRERLSENPGGYSPALRRYLSAP